MLEAQSIRVYEKKPNISVDSLMGGLPARLDIDYVDGRSLYLSSGVKRMHTFVSRGSGVTDYLVAAPSTDGDTFNTFLYAVAPFKFLGLDTEDIIEDWINLFADPKNKERLEAHRRLPNWNVFESSRLQLLKLLRTGFESRQRSPFKEPKDNLIVPIIQWQVDGNGNKNWKFDLDEDALSTLYQTYKGAIPIERFSPVSGLLFNATYSPDITNNRTTWPEVLGYNADGKVKQLMGTSQALSLALVNAADLLESKLMKKLEQHCELDHSLIAKYRRMTAGLVL